MLRRGFALARMKRWVQSSDSLVHKVLKHKIPMQGPAAKDLEQAVSADPEDKKAHLMPMLARISAAVSTGLSPSSQIFSLLKTEGGFWGLLAVSFSAASRAFWGEEGPDFDERDDAALGWGVVGR